MAFKNVKAVTRRRYEQAKAHHTLAHFLSPIFDDSYLHAFRKLERKLQHCHGFPHDKLSETTTH